MFRFINNFWGQEIFEINHLGASISSMDIYFDLNNDQNVKVFVVHSCIFICFYLYISDIFYRAISHMCELHDEVKVHMYVHGIYDNASGEISIA